MSSKKTILPAAIAFAGALACAFLLALPGSGLAAGKSGGARQLRVESIVVGSKQGPLTIRVRAGIRAEVSIWVGGKRVRHPFEFAGPNSQAIELRAADGLHGGVDKIRIRSRSGVTSSEARLSVKMPAAALVADAGADVGSELAGRVQLGTAGPVGGKTGLDYKWRIAQRPHAGAKATLTERNQPQPLFHAKTPGRYVLQLEVNPAGDGPNSFDQVVVPVAPPDPPIGAPINTMTDPDKAISVGGKTYGGGNCQCTSYLLLERTTRAPIKSGNFQNDANGLAELNKLADEYGAGAKFMRYLLILSGPQGVAPERTPDFLKLLKGVGAALPSPETVAVLDGPKPTGYSVVGIPGAPAGAATVRFPAAPEGTRAPNSAAMVGYLQQNLALESDGSLLYEYVSPDHPSYDTRTTSGPVSNMMVVNGDSLPGQLSAGVTAGLQVVAFDPLTMRAIANQTLATNGSNAANDRSLQESAASSLTDLLKRPGDPLLMVQTIGKPKAAGPVWEKIVRQLARIGANPQLVNALDGSNEYALVSRAGGEAPPAEASTAYEGSYGNPNYPAARLRGMLARGRSSNFVPNISATPTSVGSLGVNLAMSEIAYQPATAWPELAPKATRPEAEAAQKYICEGLNFCQPADSCSQVRECFWQKYTSDWHAKGTAIGAIQFVEGRGFSKPAFEAVQSQLQQEIIKVASVKDYVEKLQAPLDRTKVGSYVNLQSIGDTIWNAVAPGEQANSKAWTLGLISKAVLIGTFLPKPASNFSAGLSAILGLASYLSNKQGQPILGTEVKARTKALASELVLRLDTAREASTQVALLLVSDSGKLEAAYKHLDADWSLPAKDEFSPKLELAAKQWYWEALIPTAYPFLVRAVAPNAGSINCRLDGRSAWPNQPGTFQSNATVRYDDNGNPVKGVFFFARGIGGAASPDNNKLDDTMFRPLTHAKPGLGMEKLDFFTSRVFGTTVHALNGVKGCGVMWLPNLW